MKKSQNDSFYLDNNDYRVFIIDEILLNRNHGRTVSFDTQMKTSMN